MRKLVTVVLCLVLCFMTSCGKDDSGKYIKERENEMDKAMEQIATPTPERVENDVFILRNNTQKDIYSVEFSAEDKESLLIDAVLPSGSEVKIKNSGVWEIKAEFLAADGSYYYESFGSVDLNYAGMDSVIILSETEDGYVIESVQ